MRKPRRIAESGIYHVIARGAGRQIIFEDDIDRCRYLKDLERFSARKDIQIIAWCLMSNHVHLLLEGDMHCVSSLIQTLCSEYAQYFNNRHDRVGPLFQGRYKSEPVDSDEYLITVIRYIHNNPEKAGISSAREYRWSSYAEYINTPIRCKTEIALGIIGSVEQFIALSEMEADASSSKVMGCQSTRKFDTDELVERAIALLGKESFRRLKSYSKEDRDNALGTLRASGMSIRQIERITGIGRGIISRVKCDKEA